MTNRTLYTVRLHTDSVRVEQPNDRISIIRWKEPNAKQKAEGKIKLATRSVSLPRTSVSVIPEVLATAMQEAFEKMQDEVLRSIVETELLANPSLPSFSIAAELLTPEAVAAYAATSSNGRLTKDGLETWFDENLSDALTVAFATAMGISDPSAISQDQLTKIEAATKKHREIISGLASPKVSLPENICHQLQKAISLADNEDPVAKRLQTKLSDMLKPKELDLGLNL